MEQYNLFPRREYDVYLNRPDGYIIFTDYIPDEIPDHVLDLVCDQNVNKKLDVCKNCPYSGIITHVLIKDETNVYSNAYKKYCPILFHDLVKPSWTVEDVLK